MLTELASAAPIVGIKQSCKAVRNGEAKTAFAALDADPEIVAPFCALCKQHGVPVIQVDTMEALGHACAINVGAAVAVIPKKSVE